MIPDSDNFSTVAPEPYPYTFLYVENRRRQKDAPLIHETEVLRHIAAQMPFAMPVTFAIGLILSLLYTLVMFISGFLSILLGLESAIHLIQSTATEDSVIGIIFSCLSLPIWLFFYLFLVGSSRTGVYTIKVRSPENLCRLLIKNGYIETGRIIETEETDPRKIKYQYQNNDGKMMVSVFETASTTQFEIGAKINVLCLNVYDKYNIGIPL